MLFSLYQCPVCFAKYTSLKGVKEKATVKLDGVRYTNIDPSSDNKRYEKYLRRPQLLEQVSPCFVYGKQQPFLCRSCKESALITRMIQFKTKKMKVATYKTKYCKTCNTYYLKSSIYLEHKSDWILLNKDQLEKFEEELQLVREEKARKKAEKKAEKEAAALKQYESKKLQRQKELEFENRKKIEEERIDSELYERSLQAQQESKEKHLSRIKEKVFEHDNNIRVKDFVVRRSTFKCRHNDHKLKNIDGVISIIDDKGNIRQTIVPAGYCSNCNIFFIMESTYQSLKKRGTPICRVSDEKAYLSGDSYVNGMKLAQESVLKQYGYSVSKEEGLTDLTRRKILSLLVDNRVLTRSEVISYLDFFINQRKYQSRFEKAIEKWEDDREYISNYKIGHYTEYGVSGIYRKH